MQEMQKNHHQQFEWIYRIVFVYRDICEFIWHEKMNDNQANNLCEMKLRNMQVKIEQRKNMSNVRLSKWYWNHVLHKYVECEKINKNP